MGKQVYLYGAFQNGTRPSVVCTDISFGDLLIYETMRAAIEYAGHTVDFILPDDADRLASLMEDDVLVLGGGGIIHPFMLNRELIEGCKARKALFGVGINWAVGTARGAVHDMGILWDFVQAIPLVIVRDWQTKAFLRRADSHVVPDVSFLNWSPEFKPGDQRAVVLGHEVDQQEPLEVVLCMNKARERENVENVTTIRQFSRFNYVRSNAYHAMIIALMYGATADIKIHNVKQDAFLDSYADKLYVEYVGETGAKVKCKDQRWFYDEVRKGMDLLVSYIGA